MFRNEAQRISYKEYYLPTVEINYNVMVEGKNFFDQPVRNNFKKNDNIRKIATGQVDGYTTGCKQQALLMPIQKQYNKSILLEIYLSKQNFFSLLKKRNKQF